MSGEAGQCGRGEEGRRRPTHGVEPEIQQEGVSPRELDRFLPFPVDGEVLTLYTSNEGEGAMKVRPALPPLNGGSAKVHVSLILEREFGFEG